MDCAGEQATIENRLGRAGGLAALCGSRLCPPEIPMPGLPILSRSAALLALLLQDGTVDLELTSSVVALDPGLAFGTLYLANLERNGQVEIWLFPLAVVAAGCDRLLAMVNGSRKVESSYDCGTSGKFRQLYLRCVQRACIAEWLTSVLGNANPRQAYVVGLLSGLPGMVSMAGAEGLELSDVATATLPRGFLGGMLSTAAAVSGGAAECSPVTSSVLLADALLGLPGTDAPESSAAVRELTGSPLWRAWEAGSTRERCRILGQACRLAKWAGANTPRLSPWDFVARLHRRKSWE